MHVLRMQVCMQRLIINGRMRMTLSPLLNDMPLVGAIKFSLVQMPDFRWFPDTTRIGKSWLELSWNGIGPQSIRL